ncbi:trypsin-like peptidase domain-containing protein [Galbitalea sp. SE-J8]|uniref:S1C family serine protease n=1 Tax=Galbitalea sp. SE-J8 TaxID=3054952 RepID=UPI00259CF258|nr:trypsin-like peptidase domain-containing protein [Galbitalea sp. SE-J8]MDM4763539.1 trypsin-like peptidase domain-containing protein [Galbitalea sp. SE-J8]
MPETPDTPSGETPSETPAPEATAAAPAVSGPPPVPTTPPQSWSAPTTPVASTAPAPAGHAAPYGAVPGASFQVPPAQHLPPHLQVPPTIPAPGAHGAAASVPRRRRPLVGAVAALAVGAIIGGAAGAGVTLLVTPRNTSSTTAAASPTTITVNDPGDATVVTAVAAKASPSVVTISVSATSEAGTGSGVILSQDGYILTNTHVVTLDGATAGAAIKVTLNDGRIFTGKLIGTDPISDLAVVKIDTTGLAPATFGDSSKLNVGDRAIAIGAPLGLSGTVTDGIVSALNRSITVASSAAPDTSSGQDDQDQNGDGGPFDLWGFQFPDQNGQTQAPTSSSSSISLAVIQTDAAINPGNSGGALLDSNGDVIGINVAIASASNSSSTGGQSGSIGVGFAIPASLAQRVAKEIIADGTASHGLLGATVGGSDSDVAGAVIQQVTSGSAADKAGLKSGDIVTSFNGVPIADSTDLTAQVRALAAGSTAQLVYQRNGSSSTVTVTLGELKP